MAFIGGLISGAAEGVASRHAEKRKFDQEQKLQDTRIQGESLEKMKQERLKTQLELIMKGSGPWPQKSVQIDQAMALSGMAPKDRKAFIDSMAPVGAVHDAAQAQGLADVPSGPNVSAGSPARAVDPKEFGRHLGTAIGEHQLRGGDPKALDLTPHIGTLLGHLSAPAPQGQAQSQASFGDPGDLSSPPPPGQVPPGGAQGSASPAPTPQDQGPQVSLGELSGNSSGESSPSPRVSPPTPEPFPDAETLKTWDKKKGGPNGQISYKPPDAEWNGNGWFRPAPRVASQVSFGTPGAVPGEANSKISYGTPGASPPPPQGMAPAIQGNGQLGIGAIPSIPSSPIEGGAPPSDPNASVTQVPPNPQGGSGPSAEESPQESPQQFSDRLNSGPSSRKPSATPSSPVPSRDPQYTAPLVQYQRELDEARATAGSARDIAKIKAQNEERLKLEQGRIDLIQKMQGTSGQGRPQHSYITEGTNGPSQHIDAGKPGGYVSGADIDEEFEHGGDNATPINHDPNALYMRRTFDASGSGSEYHKVANFKGYGPVRQAPDGTFIKDILSKTGGVLGQIQVPAPSAQQQRSTESTTINPLGEETIVKRTTGPVIQPKTPSQTPGPQNPPPVGPEYSAQSGVWDTPEGASRAIAGGANPPTDLNPQQQASVRQAMTKFETQAAQTPQTSQSTPSSPVPQRPTPTSSQAGRIEPYDYLVNNKLPPRISPLQSRAIRDEANEIARRNNLSPADVDALRTDKSGAAKGFVQFDAYSQKIASFEKVLDKNIDLASRLSDAFSRSPNPTLNSLLAAWDKGVGNPEAVNLAGQLHAVANEWGKITTGSTGAQGVPMTERGDVQKFLTAALSPTTLKSFMNTVIRGDAQSRKAGNDAQKAETLNRIRGLAGGGGGTSSLDDFKKKHGLK